MLEESDIFAESSVYDSLLYGSQGGAGYNTQMATALSLSLVVHVSDKSTVATVLLCRPTHLLDLHVMVSEASQ